MSPEVFAVAPDTAVESLRRELAQRGIHGAPVVRTDGSPCGVVSVTDISDPDRDARSRVGFDVFYEFTGGGSRQLGPDEPDEVPGRVEDIMTPKVISVHADDDLLVAAKTMLEASVHRVLVCDDGKLVGVLSTHDLLGSWVETAPTSA